MVDFPLSIGTLSEGIADTYPGEERRTEQRNRGWRALLSGTFPSKGGNGRGCSKKSRLLQNFGDSAHPGRRVSGDPFRVLDPRCERR